MERAVVYLTAVVILSDRVAAGAREDGCIPVVREVLGRDFTLAWTHILPDEPSQLQALLIDLCDRERAPLVLTSGGTGLSPRDRTPQATAAVLDYEVPGIGEAMRAGSLAQVPTAMLSRAVAGVRGGSLIVNLPGSPRGVRETLEIVRPALPHALDHLLGNIVDG